MQLIWSFKFNVKFLELIYSDSIFYLKRKIFQIIKIQEKNYPLSHTF
jgi:hypothetical protein